MKKELNDFVAREELRKPQRQMVLFGRCSSRLKKYKDRLFTEGVE